MYRLGEQTDGACGDCQKSEDEDEGLAGGDEEQSDASRVKFPTILDRTGVERNSGGLWIAPFHSNVAVTLLIQLLAPTKSMVGNVTEILMICVAELGSCDYSISQVVLALSKRVWLG